MRKSILVCLILSSLSLFVLSCKKSDNSTEPIAVNSDLYPLAVGNRLEYIASDLNAQGSKIANTDSNIVRTIGSPSTLYGLTAYPVTDEYYKGSTFVRRVTNYINKDAVSGDVKYLISISQELMPGLTLTIADWFTFFKPSAGTGVTYTVFQKDTTLNIPNLGPVPANITVTGKINSDEQITVPIQTSPLSAKRIDINMKVTAFGFSAVNDLFFQQWLTAGIGPVKETGPVGTLRTVGYTLELTKKNF